MKGSPKPRKIMRQFSIEEISAVDRPAQAGAQFVIMKRNSTPPKEKNPDMSTTPELTAAQKAKIAKADKLSDMTPDHFGFYKGLTGAAAEAFLSADEATRSAQIEKAQSADPVVYTSIDGDVFRKSDDSRLVAAARRADEMAKALAKRDEADADRQHTEVAKGFESLKGSLEVRTAVVKAIAGIESDELRTGAMELLKAADATAKSLTKNSGTAGNEDAGSDGEDPLAAMAKAYATKNEVSLTQAYAEVMKTPEGQALYS